MAPGSVGTGASFHAAVAADPRSLLELRNVILSRAQEENPTWVLPASLRHLLMDSQFLRQFALSLAALHQIPDAVPELHEASMTRAMAASRKSKFFFSWTSCFLPDGIIR